MTVAISIGAVAWSLGFCCCIPPSGAMTAGPGERQISSAIVQASERFGIPSRLIAAVMIVESGANRCARSPKGAMGLMQVMPATWKSVKRRYHLGADPFDIHDNILAGTAVLRELWDRFGNVGFLPAYNAGPGRYLSYLSGRAPLSAETAHYVGKLALLLGADPPAASLRSIPPKDWRTAPLFVVRWSDTDQAPGFHGPP